MSNEKEPKTNRTQLTDLPAAEQELTEKEMEKVQGGAPEKFKFEKLPSDNPKPIEVPNEPDPPLQITDLSNYKPKK